jgi:class 3 adenylate cyclase
MSLQLKNPSNFIFVAIFFLLLSKGFSQNRSTIDSLENRYLTQNLSIPEQMTLLNNLARDHPDPSRSLLYSDKFLLLAKSQNSTLNIIYALQLKGNALTLKGDLSQALEVYLQGIDLEKEINDAMILGGLYTSVAGVYSIMDNNSNAILYYKKAIEVLKDLDEKSYYASAIENLGDEYNLNMAQPDSALYYFEESGKLWEKLKYKPGQAINMGNKGLAYAQLQRTDEAEFNITKAITLLEEIGDYSSISVYLTYMSDIYLEKGDYEAALSYADNSLTIAKKYGLKDQIADAYLKLSELNEYDGNTKSSLDFYKDYIIYRDSVKSIGVVQEIAKIRQETDEKELDLLREKERNKGNIAIGIGVALFLIALLAFGLYRRTIFISKTKKIIENERQRSDELLKNVLPEQTAKELKQSGSVSPKRFESVSVLFSDFKGYTNYAEDLLPEILVESIGFYFSAFDRIIEKHGLEKIKTIGDSYMCAGGLPISTADHAKKITLAAMEMIAFVKTTREDVTKDYANFYIRIGINSGPVVAGVVGTKKFSYDIWGDTVNVASRMESMSEVGHVNVTEQTYDLIKSDFECEYRGEIAVKNRGKLKMYFVNSLLTE